MRPLFPYQHQCALSLLPLVISLILLVGQRLIKNLWLKMRSPISRESGRLWGLWIYYGLPMKIKIILRFCLFAYMKAKAHMSIWFPQYNCGCIFSSLLPRGGCFKSSISKPRFQCLDQLSWSGYFYKEIPSQMLRFQAQWLRAWPAALN